MPSTDNEIAALRNEIRFLRDQHEIRLLPILYCYYACSLDIEAIVAQFAPDGTLELIGMGSPGIYSGAEMRAMMNVGFPDLRPWPLTHNHLVEILSDSYATGKLHAEFRVGKLENRVSHIGHYDDEYVKLGGTWKFKSRKLTATPLK